MLGKWNKPLYQWSLTLKPHFATLLNLLQLLAKGEVIYANIISVSYSHPCCFVFQLECFPHPVSKELSVMHTSTHSVLVSQPLSRPVASITSFAILQISYSPNIQKDLILEHACGGMCLWKCSLSSI